MISVGGGEVDQASPFLPLGGPAFGVDRFPTLPEVVLALLPFASVFLCFIVSYILINQCTYMSFSCYSSVTAGAVDRGRPLKATRALYWVGH